MEIPKIDNRIVDLLKEEPKVISNFLTKNLKAVSSPKLDAPGLYIFWWIGDRSLIDDNRRVIHLKGPKEQNEDKHRWITVEWKYPESPSAPIPLYVGKTTNLKQRIGQHLRLKSDNHKIEKDSNYKIKAKTTSCQVRYGLDHLFPQQTELISFVSDKLALSYLTTGDSDQDVVDRFYQEDLLIGLLKPWFNVDTER